MKSSTTCWFGRSLPALCAALLLTLTAHAAAQQPVETFGHVSDWLHEDVSTHGPVIDKLFYFILYLTVAVNIAVFAVMAWFLVRYRHRAGQRAIFVHGNHKLEMVWTLIPAVILVLITSVSQSSWSAVKTPTPAATVQRQVSEGKAVHVEVIARQFAWYFRYPGADGVFGRRTLEPKQEGSDPAVFIGLDRHSPGGRDDVVTSVLVIPVNRKVYIDLSSTDVLHSFFLPNFRVKQDAVPGLIGKVWLEATKTSAQVIGRNPAQPLRALDNATYRYHTITDAKPFDIVCAELCGANHYKMRGAMYVVTAEEFERFLEIEQKNVAGGGEAKTDDDGY